MKKISSRRLFWKKVMDYTGVAFLALLLLFLWQLYRGPIAVPFLKPYIITALNHDDAQYQVTLDSVNLELVRSIKPIKIIANNVTYRKVDGSFVINAPKTSVSFSIRALLHGVIAPSNITVTRPSVYVFTTYGIDQEVPEDINQKKIAYYIDNFQEFIERFNSEDQVYSESYINDIDINNAEVEFHEVDLGRKWVLSDLNYRFDRNFTNIETSFSALLKLGEKEASVGLDAEYRPASNKLALQAYFSDLNPGEFVDSFLEKDKAPHLYQINLPLSGKIDAVVNFSEILKNREDISKSVDAAIEKLNFEFEGGSGDIQFADHEEYCYKVSSFLLGGAISAGLNQLEIKDANFDLGGQETKLSVNVSGLKNYFLNDSLQDLHLTLRADIAKLSLDRLYDLWPRYIAEKAWLWCKDSIYGGEALDAGFVFDFAYDPKTKSVAFKNLDGSVQVADSNLNYLKGMPDIKNIYGKVTFSPHDLKVDIDKGVSNGVIMTGGSVVLSELDKEDNFADIKILADSSITDALKLIDNPPLGYTSEMGLDPNQISGTAETELGLKFELKQDLLPEEVHVNVNSLLQNVKIPDILKGKTVTAEELKLKVTNAGMVVEGHAKMDEIPLKLVWNENFDAKQYKSRYKVSFKYDDSFKKHLGWNSDVLNPPYIAGSALVDADITSYDNGRYDIDVTGNLNNTKLDFSFLGLVKPLGEKAVLKARFDIRDSKLKSISSLTFNKTDFSLQGTVALDDKQNAKLIDITSIKGPKISAKARIELANTAKQKIKINVSGNSYDLSEFFASDNSPTYKARQYTSKPTKDEWAEVTDTDINIAVNYLWTNPKVAVRNFAGNAKLRHGIGIDELHLIGNYGNAPKSFLKLDYAPHINKEYMLSVESNDAGDTLRVLRIYDDMRGGRLDIKARRTADKKIIGHAKIRRFSLHNTPVLTKLLTVASFTGMVNLLTGEGLAFSHFDAPFTYDNQVLAVKDAKAFGNVLGMTANGTYDRYYQELNIKGLFAPAYSLNTLLGKIPLVGNLLSGKDGTVFAANYAITGNISDPKISYNPLSALSPNSLKELLSSLFGSKNDG